MPPRKIVNLPDWAESRFAALCDELGIVRNKSTQDRSGWDYIIEFDREPSDSVPIDQKPGPLTARVQIKSKRGGALATSLKLTNALRFAKEPDPCFVVLFWRSRDDAEEAVYVRHFDEDLISATLRRARMADRDGVTRLHKVDLGIRFSPEDRHDDEVLDWLTAEVARQAEGYSAHKASLNQTLGFKPNAIRGTITLPASQISAMIEHCVGLRDSFEVDHVELINERFDIPARTPVFSGKPDKVEFSVQPEKAMLKLRGNDREPEFEGEFRAFWLPGLPQENFRATFKSPFIDATLTGKPSMSFNFCHDNSSRTSLRDLFAITQFVLATRTPLMVELAVEGRHPLLAGPVEVEMPHDSWLIWFEEVLLALVRLAGEADAPEMSFDDLALNEPEVGHFAALLRDGNMDIVINDVPVAGIGPACRSLAYYAYLDLAGCGYAAIIRRPCLSQDREGDDIHLVFGDPVILHQWIGPAPVSARLDELRAMFVKLVERMGSGIVLVNDGDAMQAGAGKVTCT